jgi:hypothetical protein
MKFSLSIFVLAIVIAAASCSGKKSMTPLQLNEHFVSINDTLYNYGNSFSQKLSVALQTRDFSGVSSDRDKIEKFIKAKQSELRTMEDVKGSEEFRKAMLGFLNFQSNLAAELFNGADKLSSSSTDEAINAYVARLTEMSKEENQLLTEVRKTQSAYAKKNNIMIINTSPH